jgi:hypothetical protein
LWRTYGHARGDYLSPLAVDVYVENVDKRVLEKRLKLKFDLCKKKKHFQKPCHITDTVTSKVMLDNFIPMVLNGMICWLKL